MLILYFLQGYIFMEKKYLTYIFQNNFNLSVFYELSVTTKNICGICLNCLNFVFCQLKLIAKMARSRSEILALLLLSTIILIYPFVSGKCAHSSTLKIKDACLPELAFSYSDDEAKLEQPLC